MSSHTGWVSTRGRTPRLNPRSARSSRSSSITRSEGANGDATVLLLAWAPRRRGPLPHGASQSDVEDAFPGWETNDLGASSFKAPKPVEVLLKPGERWYRLRRR